MVDARGPQLVVDLVDLALEVGAANSATSSACSESRQTSSRLRLRSNPACNMKTALLELAPSMTSRSLSPRRPSFIAFQSGSQGTFVSGLAGEEVLGIGGAGELLAQ
jgi:hypothetical protein